MNKTRFSIIIFGLVACVVVFGLVYRAKSFVAGFDGNKLSLEQADSIAIAKLSRYYKLQQASKEETGKFDPELHKKLNREAADRIVLAFGVDNPDVAARCPDCLFSSTTFKIAAFGSYEGYSMFVTLTDSKEMKSLTK